MNNAWWPLFFAQAWQLTLVIVAVAALARTCGRQRPQLAATLWLLVLIKAVTPPLWSSPVSLFSRVLTERMPPGEAPPERGESPQTATELLALESTESTVAVSVQERGFITDNDLSLLQNTPPTLAEVAHREAFDAAAPSSREPAELLTMADVRSSLLTSSPRSWSASLLVVWLLGVCGTGLITGVRVWWFQRQLQRAGGAASPELEQVVAGLQQKLGLQRPVRLWITQSDCGPAVMGVFRPCLLLPEVLARQLSPAALEPILAHELLHIRRGDLWLGWWQTVVQWLWWFHPLVWWSNRVLNRLIERCCDDDVLAELNCAPGHYARSLLATLEWKQRLRPVPTAPGVRPVDLTSERMERIMRRKQGSASQTPWWGWALLGLGMLVTLPGAGEPQPVEKVSQSHGEIAESPVSAEQPLNVRSSEVADDVRYEIQLRWVHGNPLVFTSPDPRMARIEFRNLVGDEQLIQRYLPKKDPLISSPKIEVINGESGLIDAASKRFFVTEVRTGQSEPEPVIEEVRDGLSWSVRPTRQHDGSIRLWIQSQQQEVTAVDLLNAGQESVQAPTIAARRYETTIRLESGQHAIITMNDKGDPHNLVVYVAVNQIEPSRKSAGNDRVPSTRRPRSANPFVNGDEIHTILRLPTIPSLPGETPVTIRLSGRRSTIAKEFLAKQRKSFTLDEAWQSLPQQLRAEYQRLGYRYADIEVLFEGQEAIVYVNEGPKVLEEALTDVDPGNPASGRQGSIRGELHPFLHGDHYHRAILHDGYRQGYFSQSGSYRRMEQGDVQTRQPAIYLSNRSTGPRFQLGEVNTTTPFSGPGQNFSITDSTLRSPESFPLQSGDLYDRDSVTETIIWLRREFAHKHGAPVSVSTQLRANRDSRTVSIDFYVSPASVVVDRQDQTVSEIRKSPVVAAEIPVRTEWPYSPDPLSQRIDVSWNDTPLKDAVAELTRLSGVTVILDPNGLLEAGVRADQPVSLEITGVSLRSVLKILGNAVGLGVRAEPDHQVLTSLERVHPQVIVDYPVADLVTPLPPAGEQQLAIQTRAAHLIELLTSTIAPDSWAQAGGRGSLSFHEPSRSLIVRNQAPLQEQVADLLARLRRQTDLQVSFRVQPRFVTAREWQERSAGAKDRYVMLGETTESYGSSTQTVFNAQQTSLETWFGAAEMPHLPAGMVTVMPVVAGDRRSVALCFLPAKSPSLFQPLVMTIPDGHRCLLDVTELLPADSPQIQAGHRAVLDITARIIRQAPTEALSQAEGRIEEPVVEVRIDGHRRIPLADIRKLLKVRGGDVASRALIQDDVQALVRTRWFAVVEPVISRTAAGLVLTYRVVERPVTSRPAIPDAGAGD